MSAWDVLYFLWVRDLKTFASTLFHTVLYFCEELFVSLATAAALTGPASVLANRMTATKTTRKARRMVAAFYLRLGSWEQKLY